METSSIFPQSRSKDLKELAESESPPPNADLFECYRKHYKAVMEDLRRREKCLLCKKELVERTNRMQLDNAEENINNLDNADEDILI